MVAAIVEVIWMVGLLKDLSVEVSNPVRLYYDRKVAKKIVVNPIFYERTKRIEIDYHFIREKL